MGHDTNDNGIRDDSVARYCRRELKRDATIGTRLQSGKCLDEVGMRDYLIAPEENKRDMDRVRATCSNLCTCGQPEHC
ncbi:MAG: hypothetical protein ACREVI_00675 [Steroidobacteraceae bacterium]